MREPRRWRVTSRRLPFEHPLFNLEVRTVVPNDEVSEPQDASARDGGEPDHRESRDVLVLDCADWVNVVAVLETPGKADQVVLIRQWRYGSEDWTLEIPGGIVDPGEDPADAASRELEEETGYRAGRIERLGQVSPNPAIQSNRCTTFLATNLERVGEPVGDGSEEIEVVLGPLASVPSQIREGVISHALVVAAFQFFDLYRSA